MLIFGHACVLMFFPLISISLVCFSILNLLCDASMLSFFGFYSISFWYLVVLQGKDKTPEERRIAICIFDDVAEQCRESALKYYDTYLPFLLEASNDENSDVRQVCFFVLSCSLDPFTLFTRSN